MKFIRNCFKFHGFVQYNWTGFPILLIYIGLVLFRVIYPSPTDSLIILIVWQIKTTIRVTCMKN